MVTALKRLSLIQRQHCRQAFEARFTVARMAMNYFALYDNLLSTNRQQNRFMKARTSRTRRRLTNISLDTFQQNVA
jgi:hypothetical protein